jgi:enoyl-CoA hydratase
MSEDADEAAPDRDDPAGDPAVDVAAAAADNEVVRAARDGDVVRVTVDRPDARNAMNAQVRRELKATLDTVEDSDARVVVLTGSEEASAFVAGADVTEIRGRSAVQQRRASERPRVYEAVDDLRQPVIARINGHALGGGCELALACDVRIAREGAVIGQPEITLGLIPGGGATQRLPRLVGEGQAMRLVLSGEPVSATEAAEIGLVEATHPEEAFDDAVDDLATTVASRPPLALEFAKKAVKAGSRMDLEAGVEYEAELFSQISATRDADEGIDAFLEDRDPEFEGR